MSKYIQKFIPSTKSIFNNLENLDLRNEVYKYYKENIFNKTVINKDKGYKIIFTNKPGGRKISFGGSMYKLKAEAVKMIDQLLEYGVYNNFGKPKKTDKSYVIGYLNFKAKGLIDNNQYIFRIAVQMRKDGKMYYNHEISIKKT